MTCDLEQDELYYHMVLMAGGLNQSRTAHSACELNETATAQAHRRYKYAHEPPNLAGKI